jgi:hypothetical protein
MQQLKAPSCHAVCEEISRFFYDNSTLTDEITMLPRNTGIKLPGDRHIPEQRNLYQFTLPNNGQRQATATYCTIFVIETAFL